MSTEYIPKLSINDTIATLAHTMRDPNKIHYAAQTTIPFIWIVNILWQAATIVLVFFLWFIIFKMHMTNVHMIVGMLQLLALHPFTTNYFGPMMLLWLTTSVVEIGMRIASYWRVHRYTHILPAQPELIHAAFLDKMSRTHAIAYLSPNRMLNLKQQVATMPEGAHNAWATEMKRLRRLDSTDVTQLRKIARTALPDVTIVDIVSTDTDFYTWPVTDEGVGNVLLVIAPESRTPIYLQHSINADGSKRRVTFF